MKVALAQINPTIGDISGNTELILQRVDEAKQAGAGMIVFPELAVFGYPPKDLVHRKDLVQRNVAAVQAIAAKCHGIDAIVGFVKPTTSNRGKGVQNAAAVCRDGKVVATYVKALLPTYDVFDESRYFDVGRSVVTVKLENAAAPVTYGVTICEDLWNDQQFDGRQVYGYDPVQETVTGGAKLLVNLSASPFQAGKQQIREQIFGEQMREFRVPLLYVNQVGGNDDLVFDGGTIVMDANGQVIARAKAFVEELLIVELNDPSHFRAGAESPSPHPAEPFAQAKEKSSFIAATKSEPGARATGFDAPYASKQALEPRPQGSGHNRIEPYPDRLDSIRHALVLGLRDYVKKCGFDSVVLGLSGGIDSAITAALAVEALGANHVHGVAMPSRYSSDHSVQDAEALARNLGIDYRVIPIEDTHRTMEAAMEPHFRGLPRGVAEENLQARIRGNLLMALSNKFNWLLLTTGNKSELAVGYCTLYGDMCGGLAVISDVPKTVVYELSRRINASMGRPWIPQRTIDKPPSAELRENQLDSDSLPPYDLLDAILEQYIEHEKSIDDMVALGFDRPTVERVFRLVDRSEYKRKQAAVGLRVTSRAFGTGRRIPIAMKGTV